MANPLFNLDFLCELLENKQRTLFARITALNWEEEPIEYIEGKVTGGSINIDGNSALRRTCSLTMIAKEVNINDFYWGIKSKFKLELGLANNINDAYDDIIWFKQGLFVITTFNTQQGTNNYSISINGKDKMCLLNGDLGGNIPHTTDFGIEEYYDSVSNTSTYTPIPIKTILREGIQNFGNELPQNIIINDIEDAGLELLEYRGDIPLYLLREVESDTFTNMTINANQSCYYLENDTWVGPINISAIPSYDSLVELEEAKNPVIIRLTMNDDAKRYTVAKIEYGNVPGYRLTDLTYAGDLIANVGENFTAILDKIKNMLGSYEYFYNLDGKFVFQKKKIYASIPWLNSENGDELPVEDSTPMWSFVNSQLITAFNNTPNLANVRNDFAVWGKKKTTSGSELDIHMRYAIDEKPQKYHTLIDDKDYTTDEWDWREIIYRMALDYRKYYHDDDFLIRVAEANKNWEDGPLYIDGRTGYEQYYIDLEGFWRLLYNPEPEMQYQKVAVEDIEDTNIYIQQPYHIAIAEELKNLTYKDVYVLEDGEMRPFRKSSYCYLQPNEVYSYLDTSGKLNNLSWDGKNDNDTHKKLLNNFNIESIYVTEVAEFYTADNLPFKLCKDEEDVSQAFQVLIYEAATVGGTSAQKFVEVQLFKAIEEQKIQLYMRDNNVVYTNYNDLEDKIQKLYYNNGFSSILSYTDSDNFGARLTDIIEENVYYYTQYYEYDLDTYWHNNVSEYPESLLFWFDFLEANESEMGKFSARAIGDRTKAINDNDVKSIYYREVPKVIFQTGEETFEHQTGYTYIQLQNTMENLFTISSKGKSAKERVEELLYDHAYCAESISITTLPVYHLEPNSRITIQDENSKIDGEYIVSKLTIPLTYNGTMNITATKAVSDLT